MAWRSAPLEVTALARCALTLGASPARADDASSISAPRYVDPQPQPHFVRAAAEVGALLLLGEVQYATATSNSIDWDLHYDWPSFRKKLTGDAVRFDTNRFDTNMMTHPAGGTLYYVAARRQSAHAPRVVSLHRRGLDALGVCGRVSRDGEHQRSARDAARRRGVR
jgi:hypothetical protein